MSDDHRQRQASVDPHGYQPLLVDEDVLSDEDRREQLMESLPMRRPKLGDWRDYLTPTELEFHEHLCKSKSHSPYYVRTPPPELDEEKYTMPYLGMLRRFACTKYANGRRIWYGDCPPWGSQ